MLKSKGPTDIPHFCVFSEAPSGTTRAGFEWSKYTNICIWQKRIHQYPVGSGSYYPQCTDVARRATKILPSDTVNTYPIGLYQVIELYLDDETAKWAYPYVFIHGIHRYPACQTFLWVARLRLNPHTRKPEVMDWRYDWEPDIDGLGR